MQDAIDEVFDRRIGDVSGRGKLAADMREIWVMQPRFEKRVGNTPFGMVIQPRFRAGFDFMRLRADIGEVEEALAEWWQELPDGRRRAPRRPDGPGPGRAAGTPESAATGPARGAPCAQEGGPRSRRAIGRGRVTHRQMRRA